MRGVIIVSPVVIFFFNVTRLQISVLRCSMILITDTCAINALQIILIWRDLCVMQDHILCCVNYMLFFGRLVCKVDTQ